MTERTQRPVAVVTGASSGIGEATARRLAADGYAVVVAARRADRLEALAEEIRSAGGEALVVTGDIRDLAHCESIVAAAEDWGELDVVVANAGLGCSGPFEETPDEEIRRVLDVNVLGLMRVVKAAIPGLKRRRAGRLVLVGSVLSRFATPGTAVYTASKHAVAGFADSIRFDLEPYGVRVITIMPGYTKTEFFDVMTRVGSESEGLAEKPPIYHTSEDVANVIARRIERPVAEAVVGVANLALVLLATRLPCAFRALIRIVKAKELAPR